MNCTTLISVPASVFRVAQCFQYSNYYKGDCQYSAYYCTNVLIFSVLFLINVVLFSYLLYCDIKMIKLQQTVQWAREYFVKIKSWIIILGGLLNLIMFVRYLLVPTLLGVMFNGTLYICEGLKWMIYMLTFSFYIKQSASLLDRYEVQKWQRVIMGITFISLVAYSAYGIQYLVSILDGSYTKFCNTLQFIAGGCMQFILTSTFIVFTWKIDKAQRLKNDEILMKGDQESFLDKQDKALLKARSDTILNLKVVVSTMWLATLTNLTYSTVVYLITDVNCQVETSQVANETLKFLDRLIAYIVWFYPLLYLFWPTKKNLSKNKRINKLIDYHTVNMPAVAMDSDSSSDDDHVYNYGAMGSGAMIWQGNTSQSFIQKEAHVSNNSSINLGDKDNDEFDNSLSLF